MKKRLLANLADDEDSDQFETERVTRSETPETSTKKSKDVSRRAITPDIPMKSMYTPVLPPIELLKERPVPKKYKSEEELEAYVQKQMKEIEKSVKTEKFNGLEPEVQELLDSYKHLHQQPQEQQPQQQPQQEPKPQPQQQHEERTVPIYVEERQEVEARPSMETPKYYEPESTKSAVEETVSYRLDYNKNPINEREEQKSGNNGINRSEHSDCRNIKPNKTNTTDNPWDSDLLRHVLDGGLQGILRPSFGSRLAYLFLHLQKRSKNSRKYRSKLKSLTIVRNETIITMDRKRLRPSKPITKVFRTHRRFGALMAVRKTRTSLQTQRLRLTDRSTDGICEVHSRMKVLSRTKVLNTQ